MHDQIEQSFLQLHNEASRTIVIPLDFENKDTVVCVGMDIDMDIDMEDFENSYWGRRYNNGYHCKVCRL